MQACVEEEHNENMLCKVYNVNFFVPVYISVTIPS